MITKTKHVFTNIVFNNFFTAMNEQINNLQWKWAHVNTDVIEFLKCVEKVSKNSHSKTRRGSPIDSRPSPAEASPIGQIYPSVKWP